MAFPQARGRRNAARMVAVGHVTGRNTLANHVHCLANKPAEETATTPQKSLAEERTLLRTSQTSVYTPLGQKAASKSTPSCTRPFTAPDLLSPQQRSADASPPTSDQTSLHRSTPPIAVVIPPLSPPNLKIPDIAYTIALAGSYSHGRRASSSTASARRQPKDNWRQPCSAQQRRQRRLTSGQLRHLHHTSTCCRRRLRIPTEHGSAAEQLHGWRGQHDSSHGHLEDH
jgi:hypothetical protein